jgi:hypothetical protein
LGPRGFVGKGAIRRHVLAWQDYDASVLCAGRLRLKTYINRAEKQQALSGTLHDFEAVSNRFDVSLFVSVHKRTQCLGENTGDPAVRLCDDDFACVAIPEQPFARTQPRALDPDVVEHLRAKQKAIKYWRDEIYGCINQRAIVAEQPLTFIFVGAMEYDASANECFTKIPAFRGVCSHRIDLLHRELVEPFEIQTRSCVEGKIVKQVSEQDILIKRDHLPSRHISHQEELVQCFNYPAFILR